MYTVASHTGVFGGARLSSLPTVGRDEKRAPLKRLRGRLCTQPTEQIDNVCEKSLLLYSKTLILDRPLILHKFCKSCSSRLEQCWFLYRGVFLFLDSCRPSLRHALAWPRLTNHFLPPKWRWFVRDIISTGLPRLKKIAADKHVFAKLPLVTLFFSNLTRLTAVVFMKVRFEAKVSWGFSLSPRRFRDSLSPLRSLLSISFAKKNQEKPLGPGYCKISLASFAQNEEKLL